MDFEPQYWHWIVFGMILIMAELVIPSFTIFWFGLAALAVGGILLVSPGFSLTGQLFIWALGSCLMTLLWFKILKPRMTDRTKAGLAREAIVGETGQVVKAPGDDRRGILRFAAPVLGAEEWPFICSDQIAAGDRAVVKDVSGNTLVVSKK